MVSGKNKMKYGGLGILALFVALVCAAQAAYPPAADISISKTAPAEVLPGGQIVYVISVTNDGSEIAPGVVVTDKLSYDVTFDPITAVVVDEGLGVNTTKVDGDLIYVNFEAFPAGTTGNITINVTAPTTAPTTLYNIVNVRYGGDTNSSNNRMTVATYVPEVGYNQTLAAFSFEDLLHNQSQLLFEFESLMHTIPQTAEDKYNFSVSFEQLLRAQAVLTSDFEDLLTNDTSTGWDDKNYTTENKTKLLWSYEQMLYDESFLFASFNKMIDDSWSDMCGLNATGHSQDMQTELIASFEDLLKRQNRLYKSFNLLLNDDPTTNNDTMVDFLAAYENLLRVEANLYMSFYNLLNMKYESNSC